MHVIVAGGGIVSLKHFFSGVAYACILSSLFVLVGRTLLYPRILKQDQISSYGYFYFLGIATYLVILKAFAISGLSFTFCIYLSSIMLISLSMLHNALIMKKTWHSFLGIYLKILLWTSIISCIALFLLHIIAKARGGPIYPELAEYIASSNSLPLLNRHDGQSILAAIILSGFNKVNIDMARMAVNLWLPLSQAFLVLIIYSLTEKLFATKIPRLLVCIIAFAGNCALSLLPYIPSDHDFPLAFNIYADSIIGIGISIVIIKVFFWLLYANPLWKRDIILSAFTLYFLFTALNLTAELNILVIAFSLMVTLAVSCFFSGTKITSLACLILLLTITAAAALSSFYTGGILMPKEYTSTIKSSNAALFSDSNANTAVNKIKATNINQWYLPYVIPGLFNDFGNHESLLDRFIIGTKAYNEVVIDLRDKKLTSSTLPRYLYLAELRIGTIIKILFWPLLASIGCVWLLLNKDCNNKISVDTESSLLYTKPGIIFALASFMVSLSVILLNSYPGNSLYWKWALTRLNEVGIFLMMVYVGIFVTKLQNLISIRWARTCYWIILTILFSSGVIVRLTAYPSFNG